MNVNLQEILTSYKEYTLQIIKIIEEDNLELLEGLIEKRQELVDKALSVSSEKEEGKKIYKELNLDEIQKQLNTLMVDKLEFIRAQMEKISKNKKANSSYNKRFSSATIFSKKI